MNYPHQRPYWTRRRVGLLAVLGVMSLIGGGAPRGPYDLLGQAFGLVLFTAALVALYHGVRRMIDRVGNRGQIGIVRFFLALVLGAPLAYFVLQITNPLLERASETSSGTAAAKGTQWLASAGDYLVVIFLLVSFFGLIALAIYQRGVDGAR